MTILRAKIPPGLIWRSSIAYIWLCKPIFVKLGKVLLFEIEVGFGFWQYDSSGLNFIIPYQTILIKPNRTGVRVSCRHLYLRCIFSLNICAHQISAMSILPRLRFRAPGAEYHGSYGVWVCQAILVSIRTGLMLCHVA